MGGPFHFQGEWAGAVTGNLKCGLPRYFDLCLILFTFITGGSLDGIYSQISIQKQKP